MSRHFRQGASAAEKRALDNLQKARERDAAKLVSAKVKHAQKVTQKLTAPLSAAKVLAASPDCRSVADPLKGQLLADIAYFEAQLAYCNQVISNDNVSAAVDDLKDTHCITRASLDRRIYNLQWHVTPEKSLAIPVA
jgi:hypothetical protein